MASPAIKTSFNKLMDIRARLGKTLRGEVGYLGSIRHDETTKITTLDVYPLEGVPDAKPSPINANLAFMVGQAIGFYGYRLDPDRTGQIPDIIELLSKGGHLPLIPVLPVRNSDGSVDDSPLELRQDCCNGCLIYDTGGGGYCIHCPE